MEESVKSGLISLGVDVQAAVSRFAGKEDRYMKYLKIHVSTGYFDMLEDALKKGNVDEAQRISHTLKGDFMNFEFGDITDVMVRLNELLKTGSMEGAMEMYESMKEKYSNITKSILLQSC